MAKYYLVGAVPVQMDVDEDGVWLVAFNPIVGGYISDPRYYRMISFNRAGNVTEIDYINYQNAILSLSSEYGVPHQIPPEELVKILDGKGKE